MMYKDSLGNSVIPQNRTYPRGKRALFFASIVVSCSLLLLACDNLEKVGTRGRSVTADLQPGKANFLVLTNTGFSTISGPISLTLNNYQEERQARSSTDLLRLPKPILKSTELSEPSIIHFRPPPLHALRQASKQGASRFVAPSFSVEDDADPPKPPAVGANQNFNVQIPKDGALFSDQSFTLKKKIDDGDYTVYYWINAASYQKANTSTKDNFVGDKGIENVATKFSNAKSAKDILDTSIRIFGKPWGPHKFSDLLIPGDTQDIHMLIYDIRNDGYTKGEGRVAGYFFSRDNFKAGGNAKLILNIDAPYLSRFPSNTNSTIIHELQHLIQFYQKGVLRTNLSRTVTWLNEMTAQMAVDLVSPVVGLGDQSLYKRIGRYIREPWESLTKWGGTAKDYYPISDFGAFLLRKYPINGSSEKLARKIEQNGFTDYRALSSATGHSWPEMLREWGQATLNSYPASNDLAKISPWHILKDDEKAELGIPMFSLNTAIPYMLFYRQNGSLIGLRNGISNTVKPPGPGSHVYVYLGRPAKAATLKMNLPTGLQYDIVAK